MMSASQPSEFHQGDIVRLTDEMVSFYSIYGPADPGFLSGEPVLVIESSDNRALVMDSTGHTYSTSLQKVRRL